MKKTLAFAITAQAVSIVILLVLSSQFFRQLENLSAYTSSVEHTYKVIYQLAQVRSEIKDAETSVRGYIITDKPDFLKLLDKSKTEFFTAMDSLRVLVKDNPNQALFVKNTERLGYQILRSQLENARLKDRMTSDSILKRMEYGRVQMEEIEYYIETMKANELVLLKSRSNRKKLFEDRLPAYTRSVFFAAVLLTIIFGFWIVFELKRRFRYQSLLQTKILELRQNNEELEQIAFAASHDLQEPLRKIRIFSDRMLLKAKVNGDEDYRQMANRINLAATKLHDLIGDLVTFNTLVQNKNGKRQILLNDIVGEVLQDKKQILNEMNAEVIVDQLPAINASREQVCILFEQLLDNSIQFRSEERPLHIVLRNEKLLWSEIKGLPQEYANSGYFYHIQIADNGIGFDEAFKGKMFKPFQRLHNYETDSEIGRKGMGLAICKRVMINANGWIDAQGKVNEGAIIHLYFPVN